MGWRTNPAQADHSRREVIDGLRNEGAVWISESRPIGPATCDLLTRRDSHRSRTRASGTQNHSNLPADRRPRGRPSLRSCALQVGERADLVVFDLPGGSSGFASLMRASASDVSLVVSAGRTWPAQSDAIPKSKRRLRS